jgi:hypothetical protein
MIAECSILDFPTGIDRNLVNFSSSPIPGADVRCKLEEIATNWPQSSDLLERLNRVLIDTLE